ncbi:MAG TPA: class I SAM-dependent methyltransferase [Polyangiaceae bacterium]|nr:class I SAM-dependent methyltransferase [Polyangiaceae bacterium]
MTASQPFFAIEACRVCGSTELRSVLDLGEQCLTGVFPRTKGAKVTKGPLEIVKCEGDRAACHLVQLRHHYDPAEMYGSHYGYRSSLNRSMVEHLRAKVRSLVERSQVGAGDVVLDIGSNDGTTLSFYPENARLIGMDPTAANFAKYYKSHIHVVADYFSADAFLRASDGKRARIVTSIAMFYDLDRPLDFMRQVHAVLADDGIWHFEQSYLPSMLAANSYDTICHEHAEYYGLGPIVWMADRVGFSIVDVSLNDINGGSFAVTVAKAKPGATKHAAVVSRMLQQEEDAGITSLEQFARFAGGVRRHKSELRALLEGLKGSGKRVFGIGASTKGNVILQYCAIGPDLLPCIAEVNEDKFGCFTPGTEIPIVSEEEAFAQKPDVLLVLPWHFRDNLIRRSAPLLERGIKLLFPLPKIELFPSP